MKKLIFKDNILSSRKGESLIEVIVSLMVLSILLLSVTTMIQASLRMTSRLALEAWDMQVHTINPILLSEYSAEEDAKITFKSDSAGIESAHNVRFNRGDNLTAFAPATGP